MNGGTHDTVLMFSRVKTAASSTVGRITQPRRHPVIAEPLECPLMRTVRISHPLLADDRAMSPTIEQGLLVSTSSL